MNNTEVKSIKIDRRTRKTKKAIKNAFMSLLVKNDISKITIKEISDIADINRKTFYSHYIDVNAVIDDIENEIVGKLLEVIDDYDIVKFKFNPYLLFEQFTKIINEDVDFYTLLVHTTVSSTMQDKIKMVLKEKLINAFAEKTTVDAAMLNFTLDFTATGLVSVYQEWFKSDRKISLEELSKQLSLIVANGLNSISI